MTKFSPILSISFRPFFILTALIAVINPIVWLLSYFGYLSLPLNTVGPLFWHGHEMLFSFTGALIAGFIFTASANWTGSVPYQGSALLFLIILWGIERVSYFLPIDPHLQFILMNLFFPSLVIMLLRKLWNFPKQRNVFIPILLVITIGKLLHSWGNIYSVVHLEISGREVAVGVIRFIILLIAGRVIPFFTRMKIEGVEINLPSWVNPISLLPVALLAIPWPESTPRPVLVIILVFAMMANIFRQVLWRPQLTLRIPILFILHIGIALINLELMMELVGLFNENIHFTQAALHLLMSGGLAVVGMGIMTRVTLGHTGRVIKADLWTCLSYLSIILGSIVRVFVPIFFSDFFVKSLYVAGGLWGLGFAIFLVRYSKALLGPRPDGKPY